MITIGAYITLFFIVAVWSSVLYKVNIFSKFAETTLIALQLSNLVVMGIKALQTQATSPIMRGEIILIIPLIIGALTFLRFSKKFSEISLWPVSMVIGVTIALALRGRMESFILAQIRASVVRLDNADAVIISIIMVFCLLYFLYTFDKQSGILSKTTKISRYLLMLGFGAMFANVCFGRIGSLSGLILNTLQKLGLIG